MLFLADLLVHKQTKLKKFIEEFYDAVAAKGSEFPRKFLFS